MSKYFLFLFYRFHLIELTLENYSFFYFFLSVKYDNNLGFANISYILALKRASDVSFRYLKLFEQYIFIV